MGLINHDPYMVNYSGQEITDTYIRVPQYSNLAIMKDGQRYIVTCNFSIYYSQTAFNEGRDPISGVGIRVECEQNCVSTKFAYEIAYDELKKLFPNFTDVL